MLKKTCCYLCLSVNKRTINIYNTDLLYVYENLAVLKIRENECWICYICHTRLRQCHRLQQLAVQTRGLVDSFCQNKIEFEIFGSLIELSIFKTENISTTETSLIDIKQESDVKREPCNNDVINEDEYEDNTNDYEENEQLLKESEDSNLMLVSDAVCKQDSLNVDRNDAWQGSKVLELKIVRLSQSAIDKYVRQSPTTDTDTGEYHEDRTEQTASPCTDEEKIKLKIEEEMGDKGKMATTSGEQSTMPTTHYHRGRCINCSYLVRQPFKGHALEEASNSMINILQSWITPTLMSPDDIICAECFELLHNRATTMSGENIIPLPAFGHRSVCLPCGTSILRARRTYPVRQDREERRILLRLVPPHMISRLDRVCAACIRSAIRQVQRQQQYDLNRPTPEDTALSVNNTIPVPPLMPPSRPEGQFC